MVFNKKHLDLYQASSRKPSISLVYFQETSSRLFYVHFCHLLDHVSHLFKLRNFPLVEKFRPLGLALLMCAFHSFQPLGTSYFLRVGTSLSQG